MLKKYSYIPDFSSLSLLSSHVYFFCVHSQVLCLPSLSPNTFTYSSDCWDRLFLCLEEVPNKLLALLSSFVLQSSHKISFHLNNPKSFSGRGCSVSFIFVTRLITLNATTECHNFMVVTPSMTADYHVPKHSSLGREYQIQLGVQLNYVACLASVVRICP